MKIYQLTNDEKVMKLEEVEIAGPIPYVFSIGNEVSQPFPVPKFKVYRKGKYTDYINFLFGIPIFNTKVIETVKDLLIENVQLLDMEIIDSVVDCKLLNVLNLDGAVDYNRTILRKLGDSIVGFDKLVFYEEKVRNQHIFKIPGKISNVYVSEQFRDRILSVKPKLKGFEFYEVWDSAFTLEMEHAQQAKYEAILREIEESTAQRYTFMEALAQIMDGKAFACNDFKIQTGLPGKVHILRLALDGTYVDESAGYIPPVLLDYMWVEVEREVNIS